MSAQPRAPQYKLINYFGRRTAVKCDGKCDMAWGRNGRRYHYNDEPFSDAEMLNAVGPAPDDPGSREGGCSKPSYCDDALNKWCVRECERCDILPYDKSIADAPRKRKPYNPHGL